MKKERPRRQSFCAASAKCASKKPFSQWSLSTREIFLRYYYYLQPAPEVAEAMRLTPGAVRTRLSRGRAALKKRLSQEELLCE